MREGKLHELLASEHVTPATREVLGARLDATFERRFFTPREFALLRAVAVRLVPHDPGLIDLAGAVDHRLTEGDTDGWRYADTPPDGEAIRALLQQLPADFPELNGELQDARLQEVQAALPHAFEDLLAELTETYYSRPDVQAAIGCISFADAPRWQNIGLGETDPRERDFPAPEGSAR